MLRTIAHHCARRSLPLCGIGVNNYGLAASHHILSSPSTTLMDASTHVTTLHARQPLYHRTFAQSTSQLTKSSKPRLPSPSVSTSLAGDQRLEVDVFRFDTGGNFEKYRYCKFRSAIDVHQTYVCHMISFNVGIH
jgi:hypothetical protein